MVTESNKQTGVIETKIRRGIGRWPVFYVPSSKKNMYNADKIRGERNLLTASV